MKLEQIEKAEEFINWLDLNYENSYLTREIMWKGYVHGLIDFKFIDNIQYLELMDYTRSKTLLREYKKEAE